MRSHELPQRIINRPLGTELQSAAGAPGEPQPLQAALLESRTVTGTNVDVWSLSPARSAPTPRQPAEPGPPPDSSAAAAADRLRAHQARGDERPSALPPRPAGSPSPSTPPACARSASAATRPPAARTPPTWRSAARRRRCGAAALCRPGTSTALSRFKQKLAGECCWSIPLPQASCAAGELICRRAGRGASYGLEKLRPEEAALALDSKAAGEGEGGRGAGVRPGCGAGVWRNVRTS